MVLKVLESKSIHKKLVFLILLLIIFIILQLCTFVKKHRYNVEYTINDFLVVEEYNQKMKQTYYINIFHNDLVYSYQFKDDYIGKKIITDIKYYSDDKVNCILPLFNDEVIYDITCNKNGTNKYYYLHNISSVSEGLIEFADSIKQYDSDKFIDDSTSTTSGFYDIYVENILKKISVETYKGIITYGDKLKQIDIFENDEYTKLSTYTDNYYVIPDYSDKYEFKKIYIVNLNNDKLESIKLNYGISHSSYIQGIDDDVVYLFDLENKIQYKIDCKKLIVQKIGDLNSDINVYEQGKWVKKTVSEIVKNKLVFEFKDYRTKDEDNYIDLVDNYIYNYIKDGDVYKLYKSNKYTPNIKNYLFDLDNVDNIIYDGNYIYFKNNNYIAYYSEMTGLKKIIQGSELLFNKQILFNVIL